MPRTIRTDLVVIGGGPAGLTAAISAAESGVKNIILIERQSKLGGILSQCIHNGFGLRYFNQELTGPEYAQRFIDELTSFPQIEVKLNTMVIQLGSNHRVVTVNDLEGLVCYQATAIILAMGCRERPRGAINIPGTRPAGIYTAGTIQHLMNIDGYLPGKEAVVLGSGDIGLIMARRLTLEGVRVRAVLELMAYSNGLNRNIVQCLEDYEIPLFLSHTVTKIYGDKRIQGVKAAPVDENHNPILERVFTLLCDTLVLSVGLIPENELSLMAGIGLDPTTKGPLVDSSYQTTVSGIFACGNVVHVHDLVDDVSEESKVTGRAAAAYVLGQKTLMRQVKFKIGRNIRSIVPQSLFIDGQTTIYIRAEYPETDAILKVGKGKARQRVVSPGETIRYLVKPEDVHDYNEFVPVSIEGGESS